ncbi:MAG TPA: glycogen/starch synthase [Polyangiaceae bacterium]|nr:glycogen/starch synthase [Polyangiaceae bacterium]
MDVLMVAAELGPHARATAAADSIAALAKAIRQLGHTVTVALPRTNGFQNAGLLLARRLSPLTIEPGLEVTVLDGQLASGVAIVLFDAPGLETERGVFGAPGSAEAEADGARYALFARAAAAYARERKEQGRPVDVVHLHDWPAAPVAALLAGDAAAPPTVLTVHGLAEERTFEPARLAGLGALVEDARARLGSRVSPLRLGIGAARALTTVSAGYAEALSKGPLSALLAAQREPLSGVLEGVDYAIFNPATDSAIESRFDAEDLSNKGRCKTALLRAAGLRVDLERPLLVALLSGVDAAGCSQLLRALPRLLDQDVAIVVAGAAEPELQRELEQLKQDSPDDLGVSLKSEDVELRRWLAAADFALTIRAHAPSAPLELAAQRYGALPIAAASGGTSDAVIDIDAELETGTGFLYQLETPDGLVGAVERALSAYGDARFVSLQRRVMRRDLGWDRPARRYVQLYRKALGEAGPG